MKRISALIVIFVLVCSLSGCGLWTNGEYLSVTPHELPNEQSEKVITEVSSYSQLSNVLNVNVSSCAEKIVVSTESFNDATVGFYAQTAINHIMNNTPVGAYAVERIDYEIGTNRGEDVVEFNVSYRYPATDILSIHVARDSDEIKSLAIESIKESDPIFLARTDYYSETDFEKFIYDYIMTHGDEVVETPEYSVSVYPKKGEKRIVEIKFYYDYYPQEIKTKQRQLEEAILRVENNIQSQQVMEMYKDFYTYITENSTYTDQIIDMPVYSLLCDLTGDSRAYAMTFAVLCRRADLECQVITGTYNDVQRYWNVVVFRGEYYHLDILKCQETDGFALKTTQEMSGYLWDADFYEIQ